MPTPAPSAMNMYPSWLTVEYAITRLRSVCVTAIDAASSAVAQPVTAISASTPGASVKKRHRPAIKYTPAVTIVAA